MSPSSQMIVPYSDTTEEQADLDDNSLYTSDPKDLNACPWEDRSGIRGILDVQDMTLVWAKDLLTAASQPNWSWTRGRTTPREEPSSSPYKQTVRDIRSYSSNNPSFMSLKGHQASQEEELAADSLKDPKPRNDMSASHEPPVSIPTVDPFQFLNSPSAGEPRQPFERFGGSASPLDTPVPERPRQGGSRTSRQRQADQLDGLTPFERFLLNERDKMLVQGEQKAKKEAVHISRLEQLLTEQHQARIEKEEAKKRAAEEAVTAAADVKKRADEDKLSKLEKLILAQKEEQLKREAAAEVVRAAERAEKDAKTAKEAEETKAAHEKALQEARIAKGELERAKRLAEEEAAKLKPAKSSPPIKLQDVVDRKFIFPWHLCKNRKGLEELIKGAFMQDDKLGPHVLEGHYDLLGPDAEVILPQLWEIVVQPDWPITMRMWPLPEMSKRDKASLRSLAKMFERQSENRGKAMVPYKQ